VRAIVARLRPTASAMTAPVQRRWRARSISTIRAAEIARGERCGRQERSRALRAPRPLGPPTCARSGQTRRRPAPRRPASRPPRPAGRSKLDCKASSGHSCARPSGAPPSRGWSFGDNHHRREGVSDGHSVETSHL
jgi:hypothetical protein